MCVEGAMAEYPFISVVVPIHNEEKHLSRCIDALLRQDYPSDRFEIILVDDGSRDGSPEICWTSVSRQSGTLPRVSYVRISHSGLSVARNVGVSLAKGDIIAFIDGDALASREWIREIVAAFENAPRVGVVGGRILPLNPERFVPRLLHWIGYYEPGSGGEEQIHVIGTNMAYRRAVFEQEGGFFEPFHQRGDETAFLLKVLRHWEQGKAPNALVRHEHPERLRDWLRERFKNGQFFVWVHRAAQEIGLESSRQLILRALGKALVPGLLCASVTIAMGDPLWALMPLGLAGVLLIARLLRRGLPGKLRCVVRDFGSPLGWCCGAFGAILYALGLLSEDIGFVLETIHRLPLEFYDDVVAAEKCIEELVHSRA